MRKRNLPVRAQQIYIQSDMMVNLNARIYSVLEAEIADARIERSGYALRTGVQLKAKRLEAQ